MLAKLVKRKDGEETTETFEASYLIGADGAKGVQLNKSKPFIICDSHVLC